MTFPISNFLIYAAWIVLAVAIAFCLYRFSFGKWPASRYFKLSVVVVICFLALNLFRTNSPRFVLTDESGIAPSIEGDLKSSAPKVMTDQERLDFNRRLNDENSK